MGFVQHPSLGPEIAGLSFVHQLHCVQRIREGYCEYTSRSLLTQTALNPISFFLIPCLYISQALAIDHALTTKLAVEMTDFLKTRQILHSMAKRHPDQHTTLNTASSTYVKL